MTLGYFIQYSQKWQELTIWVYSLQNNATFTLGLLTRKRIRLGILMIKSITYLTTREPDCHTNRPNIVLLNTFLGRITNIIVNVQEDH